MQTKHLEQIIFSKLSLFQAYITIQKWKKYILQLRRLCRNEKNEFYIELLSLFGNAIVLQDQKIIFVNG